MSEEEKSDGVVRSEKAAPSESIDSEESPHLHGSDAELARADHNLGRLVVDPEEAKAEFGEEYASKLKRTPDGKWICWPQP